MIRPRMQHYVEVSRAIRALMLELTPAVEPLSLDEAFLDLTGTERLHRAPPAVLLARLQARIERELGITASVGLSHNKFLAKIASDLDKPRGLAADRPRRDRRLPRPPAGLDHLGRRPRHPRGARARGHPHHRRPARPRPQGAPPAASAASATGSGASPAARTPAASPPTRRRSRSRTRPPSPPTPPTSTPCAGTSGSLCEQVSARAKAHALAGATVTLKLKRSDHGILTRRQTLGTPDPDGRPPLPDRACRCCAATSTPARSA